MESFVFRSITGGSLYKLSCAVCLLSLHCYCVYPSCIQTLFFHVYIIQAFVFLKKNNICSLQLKFMKVMIRFLPKFFKEIPVAKLSAIRLSCLQTPASFYVNSNLFFFLIVYITQLKRIYFFQIAQF